MRHPLHLICTSRNNRNQLPLSIADGWQTSSKNGKAQESLIWYLLMPVVHPSAQSVEVHSSWGAPSFMWSIAFRDPITFWHSCQQTWRPASRTLFGVQGEILPHQTYQRPMDGAIPILIEKMDTSRVILKSWHLSAIWCSGTKEELQLAVNAAFCLSFLPSHQTFLSVILCNHNWRKHVCSK